MAGMEKQVKVDRKRRRQKLGMWIGAFVCVGATAVMAGCLKERGVGGGGRVRCDRGTGRGGTGGAVDVRRIRR